MRYLLDSSALLAHLFEEPGANLVRELFHDPQAVIELSVLSALELFAALNARGQGDRFEDIWGQYWQIVDSVRVVDEAVAARHGLRTPADLHLLAFAEASVLPSVYVKTLGVRNSLFRSGTRTLGCASPLRPTGFSVYASPALFATFRRLRHGRKTRYGWVAGPYPAGTRTPQETPSLSRRDNAQHQPCA